MMSVLAAVFSILKRWETSKCFLLTSSYFTFLDKCKENKACTILLRGPSKDILNEIDRNLADAMSVARNIVFHPMLAPGGGATEMAISVGLANYAGKSMEGVEVAAVHAVADAMEVIPRTLIQNCGGNPIKTLTQLRARHANGEYTYGVDGNTGRIVEMKQYGLFESASVKIQILKTAIEVRVLSDLQSASLLLRVDDVVSAKRVDPSISAAPKAQNMAMAGGNEGMDMGMA